MNTVKIRRAGNSNAMTLPRELEALGYIEGAEVVIKTMENGALMVMTAAQVEEYIDAMIDQVVADNRGALDLLAAHDRGERPARRRGVATGGGNTAAPLPIAASGREH